MKKVNPKRLAKIESTAAARQPDLVVVLENVHDGHNIGAVMRSAEIIGINDFFVLYTDDHLTRDHIKLGKKTSSGARKWLNVHLYKDAVACFEHVRSIADHVLGAHLSEEGVGLYDIDFLKPTALVFGNEHRGISDETLPYLDGCFTIPQYGMTQSLNISVACGVSFFEASRQRQKEGYYKGENPKMNAEIEATIKAEYLERHDSGYNAHKADLIK